MTAGGAHNKALLQHAIERALLRQSVEAASVFVPPANSRSSACSVETCTRPAYASGYCNAHYLRKRKGKDLTAPVRARKRFGRCSKCGADCGAKGGWGMCPAHYRATRYAAIKDALIATMGGRCHKCGGVFHRAVYDFHHQNALAKTESPSYLLTNAAPAAIAEELATCVLLCANCHRLEHTDEL